MKKINVVKRDGSREPLDISKVQTQIGRACDGITNVSESMIELRASIQFEDNMTTETIDNYLLRAMIDLINVNDDAETNHTNYQYVAGKQRLRMLRKDVYGQYVPPPLYEIVKRNVEIGVYTPELLEWYSEEDWNKMDGFIDHEKDEKYSFSAIEQLITKYLVRNRVTDVIYETPQIRYMIAAAVCFHMEGKNGKRLGYVRDYYEAASTGAFTLATPVLAGLGTNTKQFSSCVLLSSDDTLDSIFATGEMMAKYAAKRAGIGLEMGRMRGVGSPIRGGEIKHTGITPFLKKWFGDLRSCSQGGIRNASATVNAPIWHIQFDDFIVMKNNQGTEENRVRHLDYCVQLNAMFFRRFKDRGVITLFDPQEVPELYDAFFRDSEEFERLYIEAENNPKILRKKEYSAEKIFKEMLLKERTDTGRIYLMFVDNVMRNTPFDVTTHPIVQTNLCLTGDTMVDVVIDGKNASIPISEVSASQNVLIKSKHIDSDTITYSTVSAAGLTGYRKKIILIEDDVSGRSIRCTPEHPIFTKNRGWVEAKDLEESDELEISVDNNIDDGSHREENLPKNSTTRSSISITEIDDEEDVYDLTVEGVHNFYANGILVHNCVEILLPTKPFQRIDPQKKIIRVKKSDSAIFEKEGHPDVVEFKKISK